MTFFMAAIISAAIATADPEQDATSDSPLAGSDASVEQDYAGIAPPASSTEVDGAPEDDDVEGHGESMVQVGESRTIEIGETVEGDAVIIGGNLTIDGIVRGDAVCVGGTLRLGPTAVIEGDAVSVGGRSVIDAAAAVRGDRVSVGVNLGPIGHLQKLKEAEEEDRSGFLSRLVHLAWEIVFLLFLMFLALLLTVFMPRQAQRIEDHLTGDFPRTSLLGIGIMVLLPLVLLVMTVTIIGIPLIPLVLLATAVTGLLGYLVFARVLGRRIAGERHALLQILIGLLLLQGASMLGDLVALPGGAFGMFAHILNVIGTIIFLGGNFLGLGAVVYSRWGGRTLDETRAMRAQNGHPK